MRTPPDFHYRIVLNQELARRLRANPRYSLRAYARALRLDAGNLSRILNSKKGMSYACAQRVANRLGLSPSSRAAFLGSVLSEQEQTALRNVRGTAWSASREPTREFNWERFAEKEIGWYYLAILNLVTLESARPDPAWMAKTLGIPLRKARAAVRELLECGLLEESSGRWRRTALTNPPPESIRGGVKDRRYQSLMLGKASRALRQRADSFARGTTIAVPPEFLPQIEEMVREFVYALRTYADALPRRRLYHCVVGLFPLQREEPHSPVRTNKPTPSRKETSRSS